jgi:DNA-binding winged helix-turn-helix (wHTH) protein/tetratricopeptide (TPR) repeat protein
VFEVDPRAGELRKSVLRIKLQDQPLQVLIMLLEHPGEMVTREELQRRLWPADTFVDFDHSLNSAVKKLREALGDQAENPRFIETLHRRGYRFIAPVEGQSDAAEIRHGSRWNTDSARVRVSAELGAATRIAKRWKAIVPAALTVLVLSVGGYFYFHRAPKLTEKDTIVLADFANNTGDAVFDGTLRQGLSVQLEQSPFLSIVSDQQIRQTLQMMSQKPDEKLTPEIAREICQRTASAAVLYGSIAQIGTQYLLTVKAVNCVSGETLASTEAQANDKNHVFDALGKTVSEIRNKLGESLSTVKKFNTPLEQATTPSLEALQAYSLGRQASAGSDWAAAVPFLQRAIRLDPNFAMAYARLGTMYSNLGEGTLGAENTRKAYELRDRVSEEEKFYIESHYYQNVTGDLEKARQSYQLWTETYPRDWQPRPPFSTVYSGIGEYDKALAEAREALRLDPARGLSYSCLVSAYVYLNRLDEARSAVEEAQAKKLDSPNLHFLPYQLSFLQNDAAGMAQQVAWAAGKPGVEDVLLSFEADTAAYAGRLGKAGELTRRAAASAERAEEQEVAAGYEIDAAMWEAYTAMP